MGASFVQLPADSTGKKLATRQRTVGANTVEEQYYILQSERVVTNRGMVTSFRTPARAVATQPLFVLFNNNSAGGTLVAVRRLSVEVDSIAAKAVLSPYMRTVRVAAAPTGGTTLLKSQGDTLDSPSGNVTAYGDASADGTLSATALAITTTPAQAAWQQSVPRWHTLVGYQAHPPLNMLPDDSVAMDQEPFLLRNSQGVSVRMDAAAALVASDFHFFVKCAWDEFTLP